MQILKGGTVMHSIYRGVLIFASFALTMMVTGDNGWTTITLGTVVAAVVHWISSQLAATK